eukprot:759949-Hanusia_phi.AAC.1
MTRGTFPRAAGVPSSPGCVRQPELPESSADRDSGGPGRAESDSPCLGTSERLDFRALVTGGRCEA